MQPCGPGVAFVTRYLSTHTPQVPVQDGKRTLRYQVFVESTTQFQNGPEPTLYVVVALSPGA